MVKVNELKFKTKQEVYDYYKIKGHTVTRRINEHNISFEDEVNKVISEKLIVYGQEFSNQAELCKHYKISQDPFQKQKKQGLNAEQIVDKILSKRDKYVIQGKDYKTMTNVLKSFEISECILNKRLRSGMTL